MASNSSWDSLIVAPITFSSRCFTEEVPGIGSIVLERWRSQCDLTGFRIMPPGDLVERPTLASKLSRCQRRPGDKANTLVCTDIDYLFGLGSRHIFGFTISQIIVVLNADNGHDPLRSCKLIDCDIGEPDMADFPLLSHLGEHTDGDLKRNLRVRAMELIDVDAIEAQTSQTAL